MNHTYRLVWNNDTQRYVPAPECAKGQSKTKSKTKALAPAAVLLSAAFAMPVWAQAPPANELPTGGNVVSGNATISQNGNQMTVGQGTNKAIIDWTSFNIGKDAAVTFNQLDRNSIALNRVTQGDASQIHGQLNANGQVWLVNPNGVVFGAGSKVDVGGLVASTMNIANDDFLNGNYKFSRNGATGSITNQGELTAKDGGYIALLAPTVSNDGILRAQLGTVAMAAGDKITLQAGANGLLNVQVDPATIRTLIENKQLIVADGGQVIMTGKAADALAASVVSNTGTIQANTLQERDGKILLIADMQHGETQAAGKLEAKFIDTSAATVSIDKNLKVNTNGGEWLIDPVDITIDSAKATAIEAALGTGDVTVSTSNGYTNPGETEANNGTAPGDIHVHADISYTANQLTLNADRDIHLNAAIHVNGSGTLALNYGGTAGDSSATPAADSTIRAHFGDSGGFKGQVNFANAGDNLLQINGADYTVIQDATALQAIRNELSGHYALGGDVDASGINNFESIGTHLSPFTGSFDGLGHTISGMTTGVGNSGYGGLFGKTKNATLRNVGLEGVNIQSSRYAYVYVGGLVGLATYSSISHAYATGVVSGGNGSHAVGGLVGQAEDGNSISHAYATAAVSGNINVGGLVGKQNNGSDTSHAYASGAVSGTNSVGGLVGYLDGGDISHAYATGQVSGSSQVGGLVGLQRFFSNINHAYASGAVSGSSQVGGLVGDQSGSERNSTYYATTDAAGNAINQSSNALGTGKTFAQLADPGLYTGWDSSVWSLAQGAQAEGYEVGLPALIGVTRAQDVVRSTWFDSGWGTEDSAYGIADWGQLSNMRRLLDKHYQLNNDLDSSTSGYTQHASATANGGAGFIPIGDNRTDSNASRFTGVFDGQGHTVGDMVVNVTDPTYFNIYSSGSTYAGLFGHVGYGAQIRNVGLVNATVSASGGSRNHAGVLVGVNYGDISQSYASGSVSASGGVDNNTAGGLVGWSNYGSIRHSYASSSASASGGYYNYAGGLVGYKLGSTSTIEHSYASGSASASAGANADERYNLINYAGGLVGGNIGPISHSYASGSASASGSRDNAAGGLVGHNNSMGSPLINTFYATTDAAGNAINQSSNALGTGKTFAQLADPSLYAGWDSSIWSLAQGAQAEGYEIGRLPSLIGVTRAEDVTRITLFADGWGTEAAAYGIANWGQLSNMGLLLDKHYRLNNDLDSSTSGYAQHASATANGGAGWQPIGDDSTPFTGSFDGQGHTIGGLHIDRPSQDYVGLFGETRTASVQQVGLIDAQVTGRDYVGSLVGFNGNSSNISHSYASGGVVQGHGNGVGGLAGFNAFDSSIGHSYASSHVQATNSFWVGGLVGSNLDGSTISNSYATGAVTAGSSWYVGGLVGENDGSTIAQSYATGLVAGGRALGGLVGSSYDSSNDGDSGNDRDRVDNSYYATTDAAGDIIHNNGATNKGWGGNAHGTGKTLNELKNLSTFADWGADIDDRGGTGAVWRIYEGQSGPLLRSFLKQVTVTADAFNASPVTYNGNAVSVSTGYTTSDPGAALDGSLAYTTSSKNAGDYSTTAGTLALGGLYSGQQGYDISYANTDASLTIDKAELTVTGTTVAGRTYDGSTDVLAQTAKGTVTVFDNDQVTLGVTSATLDSKNAGSRTATVAYALTGGDAGNYTVSDTAHNVAIERRALTVSGITTDSKIYDGTTDATVRTDSAVLDGLVAGDDLHVSATGQFHDKRAGTAKTVTLTSSYSGADRNNYDITGQADTTADIDRKALTVSGITADNKTYDGMTNATLRGDNMVLDGLVAGDDLHVIATGQFSDKHAGTDKTVTLTSGYAGIDVLNYAITNQADTTADIDRRVLTVSGITADSKTYDGTTNATVRTDSAMLDGLVHGDDLRIDSIIGVFEDKHAGIDTGTIKTVILTSSYSGADRNNYDITSQASATAEIERKALTVSGITAERKTYDGTTDATVHTDNAVLDGLVAGDDLRVVATGQFSDKNAGTDKTVILTSGYAGIDVRNYAITDQTDTTADIDRRALFVSGITADSKTYDGTTDATVHTSGAQSAGLLHGDDVRIDSITGVFEDKHAGTDKKVILTSSYSGADRNNYDIISQASATADIDRRALTVSGITAERKTYDGSTVATVNTGGAQFDGLVAGDNLTVSATGVFDSKNAGQGKTVTLTSRYAGADAGNYAITDQADTTADIDRKALTVTGTTVAGRTYNGSDDVLAQTAKGIVTVFDNDQVTLDVTSATLDSKNAGSRTATVAYALTGDDAGNYTVADSTHSGIEISQKALTVTGTTVAGKTYDSTATANVTATGTLNQADVIDDDTVTLTQASGSFADKNAGKDKAVTVQYTLGGADGDNYFVADNTGLTATIDKAELTVTGTIVAGRTYDGSNDVLAQTGTGTVTAYSGDNVTLGVTSATLDSKNAGTRTATVVYKLTGTDADNYTVLNSTHSGVQISQKALTVGGITADNKTYDGGIVATVNTGGAQFDGLVAGDDLTVSATGQFSDKNAAQGKTVMLTSLYDGADVDNYAITDQATATADIDRKALTVTGITVAGRTYNGSADVLAQTAKGTVTAYSGDDVTLGVTSATLDSKNAGTRTATVAYALTGDDAGNYTVADSTHGGIEISQKALTVGGITADNKTYDGGIVATVNTGGAQFDGLVAGDDLTVSATGQFSDKNAAQGKTVMLTSLYDGADVDNYAITDQATATADIDRKALTVTGTTVAGRTYNGSADVLAQTGTGTVTVYSGDDVTLGVTSATLDSKNAGTRTATVAYALTGDDAGNYTVADSTHGGIEIGQKALTVTGTTVAGKTYDSTATANITATGTLNQAEVIDDDTVTLTEVSGSFADKNAGKDKAVTVQYTLGGADGDNYFVADNTGLTATIDKAELTVTGTIVAGRTYDGSTDVLAQTGTGTVSAYSGDDVTLGVTSATLDSKNAGTRTATVAYALTGTDADNYTVLNSTHSGVQISQKALTVGGITADNKTYDGGTVATVNTGSVQFDGLVAGDNLTVSTTGQFSDKNAAQGKTVTLTSRYSGADAGNYAITDQTSTTADIDRKALTVGGITADNKTYDGSTAATVRIDGAQFDGLVAGDNLTVSTTGQFSDKNADQGKTVTLVSHYDGTDRDNYEITDQTTTTADIDRKALTIGGITADNKTYDGNTVATVNMGGAQLDGLVDGDDLRVTASGVFSDKNAAQGKTVTLTSRYGGADVDNYAITDQTSTTADIDRKALTVGGITADNKTYDGNTVATVHTDGARFDGLVAGDNLTVSTTGVFSDKNAGQGKTVTLTSRYGGADVDNYAITDQTSTTADIDRKALTVAGTTVADKTYDGNAHADVRLGTISGWVGEERLNIGVSGTFDNKNAGTGKHVDVAYTLSDGDNDALAGNYRLTDGNSYTADIERKALTVGGITADRKTYDGSTAATVRTDGAQFDGLVEGDDLRVIATGQFSDKNADQGKTVTLTSRYSGVDAGNYAITDQTSTTADIDRKALTVGGITADHKTYDGNTVATVNTGGAQFDGLVEGDDLRVIATGQFSDKNADQGKTVTLTSRYSGVDAGNYAITDQTSTSADIDRKALTVGGITADHKTYDGSTVAMVNTGGAQFDGLVEGDDLTVFTTGQFSDKNADQGKTVTLTSRYSGADAGNYAITDQATATADIDRKALTISGITADRKTYDGSTAATVRTDGVQLDGLVDGDDLRITASGQFGDKNAGVGKTVNVTATVGGTDAGNYDVTFNRTARADIDRLAITGTVTADGKTYDGTLSAVTHGSLSGVLQGDDLSVASTGGSFTDKNAGRGKTVNVTATVSGTDAGNYDVTFNRTAQADIAARALTITVRNATRPAGVALALSGSTGFTASGLVQGETVGSVTLDSAGAPADAVAGTYAIAASNAVGGHGFDAANYDIQYVDGSLTVISPMNGGVIWRLAQGQSDPRRHWLQDAASVQTASSGVPYLTLAPGFIPVPGEESARD